MMEARLTESFDVICAGEALWKLAPSGLHLRPGGGAVDVAVSLARQGLRVGLATVLADDEAGRSSYERIAASGVDVGGVALARPRSGFVLVDASGGANQVPSSSEEQQSFGVPAGWSSQVLLLSGLSPVVSHAATLCKAARSARRQASLVVIDFNASLHVWAGRDPRAIQMVLREVDVARCSYADLAVLGMDLTAVRAALRKSAVLVVSDDLGGAIASGPFGEVACRPEEPRPRRHYGLGDAFTASICRELTRRGDPGESAGALWYRALHRGRLVKVRSSGASRAP